MAHRKCCKAGCLAISAWLLAFASASLSSRRAEPPAAAAGIPAQLSETRIFSDLASLTPAAGVVPYDVNVPSWSDGAIVRRWMVLPGDGSNSDPTKDRIIVKPGLPWAFPAGAIFVQHFDLPDRSKPSGVRRTETRVLVRDKDGGVYGVTYKWNAEGTDATLLSSGESRTIALQGADGRAIEQPWDYPSPDQCVACHNQAAGGVLGVTYRQINRAIRYQPDGRDVNQVEAWNGARMISKSLDGPSALAPWNLARLPENMSVPFWNVPRTGRLAPIDDESTSVQDRARAYLDANCSYCHAPGIVSADWDARSTTPLAQQMIVGARARVPRPEADVIVLPGNPERSLLYVRVATANPALRMPPLGRHAVDERGARLLHDWIRSLGTAPASR